MYPGKQAQLHPDRAAFIMAGSGQSVSYAELDARSNRLAHLLRAHGLRRLDHYAMFMANNSRFIESSSADERAGLYCTRPDDQGSPVDDAHDRRFSAGPSTLNRLQPTPRAASSLPSVVAGGVRGEKKGRLNSLSA